MVIHVMRSTLAAALGLALLAPAARAAEPAKPAAPAEEMVENPAYKSWAEHKAGTTVVLESSTDAGGQKLKMEITQKLVELTKDKAVVEVATKLDLPGVPAQPPQKQTFPAKVKKSEAQVPGKLPPGAKGEMKDKGSEKVKVGGKDYECKVYEFTGEQNGVKSSGKIWQSDKVPGTLVKMESTAKVGEQDMKSSMAVTKIETK
jgi:hypothetical protein